MTSQAEALQRPDLQPVPPTKLKPLQMLIAGKCTGVEPTASGKSFAHEIMVPAADAYSYPGSFMVYATKKLFHEDQPCQVLVDVRGSRRVYDKLDKKTGEVLGKGMSYSTSLWAVESNSAS